MNIEGFKRNGFYLSKVLRELVPDIVFLQEIWLPYSEEPQLKNFSPEYDFTISSPDKFQDLEDHLSKPTHIWYGVAVGWRKDIANYVKIVETNCDRIACIEFSYSNSRFLFLSFYAPTSG